ncbi:hypothetical protein AVEN_122142-1 [Araneus ventricosus]|uniref:Uncharacterized protein n=1 Tax=Araneus ventricosus TaxID=182803 RepID=A0A4Y2IA00_ARAVE|nr:hypothetical protein AVEN_122142-1 [Araneus ventricosus]
MLKARYTHSSKDPTWRLFTHVTGNFQSKSKAARRLWGKECRYLRDVFRALDEGTVQSGGASVMVWDVCSWCDMGPLTRLETTLTGT